jgi:hypothetical protein
VGNIAALGFEQRGFCLDGYRFGSRTDFEHETERYRLAGIDRDTRTRELLEAGCSDGDAVRSWGQAGNGLGTGFGSDRRIQRISFRIF